MIIEYCHACGLRIREPDIKSGAATRDSEERLFCPQCRPPRKRSGSQPAAVKDSDGAARLRESRAAIRSQRSAGTVSATSGSERKSSATPRTGLPPQVLIVGGAGAVVLLILAALMLGNRNTPAPKQRSSPVVATRTPAAITPSAIPQTLEKKTAEELSGPQPKSETESVDDIRESYARRLWDSMKADLERNPGSKWSINRSIQEFARSYSSTKAGKEAAAFLQTMGSNLPPEPTPDRIIADFKADFADGTPKSGWQYLWNGDGEIGRSTNYKPLPWNATNGAYMGEAGRYPALGTPQNYARLDRGGGHPGEGADQNESGGVDRYVIAAYTLQQGQDGRVAITGELSCGHGEGGVELRLYVNDTSLGGAKEPGGGPSLKFATWLGTLKESDTIYVAVGPDRVDGNDSFGLSFSIYK